MTNKRIGILGGSFDPPHAGHLRIAKAAVRQLRLDVLFIVPARIAPHKRERQPAATHHRLAMLRAMVRGIPRVHVSAVEVRRPGVSFTVDTVRHFRRRFRGAELFLIIGGDSLSDFRRWKHPDRIRRMVTLAVYARNGSRAGAPDVQWLRGPRLTASSTDVRDRLASGRSIGRLLPGVVATYIRRYHLYRTVTGHSHGIEVADYHRARR